MTSAWPPGKSLFNLPLFIRSICDSVEVITKRNRWSWWSWRCIRTSRDVRNDRVDSAIRSHRIVMKFTNSFSKSCKFPLRLLPFDIYEVRSADGKPLRGSVMNMSFMKEFTNSCSESCECPLRIFCLARSWRQNLQFKLTTRNSNLANL